MRSHIVFLHIRSNRLAETEENVAIERPRLLTTLAGDFDAALWLVSFVVLEGLDELLYDILAFA